MWTTSFWVTCILDMKEDDDKVFISNYGWENGGSEQWVICRRLWETEAELRSIVQILKKPNGFFISSFSTVWSHLWDVSQSPNAGCSVYYGSHACMEGLDKCFSKNNLFNFAPCSPPPFCLVTDPLSSCITSVVLQTVTAYSLHWHF